MNGLHCAATGRIVSDPEEKFTASGKSLVNFSLLVDVAHTVATDEKAAAPAMFLRVTSWEPGTELLAQLRKGASVYVEGKLSHDQWTGQDDTPRCGLKVSAWRVDVHGAIGKQALQRAVEASRTP